MNSHFTAPFGLRNRHLQTILSSIGPRKAKIQRRFAEFAANTEEVILNCHDGIRLAGSYNRASSSKASHLAILLHGWEGGADSTYMISMASHLLRNGVDVFRLNLRDHGDTHHLNEGLFNSTLLPEVKHGLLDLQQRLPYLNYNLIGFSLGGNFALRVAASGDGLSLNKVITFCPVLHALSSNSELLRAKNKVYQYYFIAKWKRSLNRKLQYFPEYDYGPDLKQLSNLNEMNQYFVPRFTGFNKVEDYFDAYAITGDVLQCTICPCYLHFSKDDMIIPWQDVERLADNSDLHVWLAEHGGHCGFLSNWQLDSWQDNRALEILQQ